MLYSEPKTAAEKLALHLETEYGLQLDPFRHKHLVNELEGFGAAFVKQYLDSLIPEHKEQVAIIDEYIKSGPAAVPVIVGPTVEHDPTKKPRKARKRKETN